MVKMSEESESEAPGSPEVPVQSLHVEKSRFERHARFMVS